MNTPLPHTSGPRPSPQAVPCKKCPAWMEFRSVESFRGERSQPWCLEHDRNHFECCPGAKEILQEGRDRMRQEEKVRVAAMQDEWEKKHPALEKFL